MMGLATVAVAVSAALLLRIAVRLRQLRGAGDVLDPLPAPPPPPSDAPLVSIVVPARNEERDLGACLRSLAAQDWPRTEIIVVDDRSEDRTLEVARAALAGHSAARVIAGEPRPADDWIGKSWALDRGVRAAKGEWLLFSDADIVHHPQTLTRAMESARAAKLDAISILPIIECRSVWEKMLMPLFGMLAMLLEPLDRTNRPGAEESRFSGAFILVRRAAYDAAGGHAAVRADILDDLALARRLKAAGSAIRLVRTHELSTTRMYDRFRDAWQGLNRLSYPMLKYSPGLLLVAFVIALFGAVVPWLALLGGAWVGGTTGWSLAVAGAGLIGMQMWALSDCYRLLRVPALWALFLPAAAGLTWIAAAWAAWCHHTGRGIRWKNRVYGGRAT